MEVIFVFYGKRLEFSHKLLLFIFAERALMALKWTLESVLGSKTVAQLQAEEQNEKVGAASLFSGLRCGTMARKWTGHGGFGWVFDDFRGVRPLVERRRCWRRSCRHHRRMVLTPCSAVAPRAEGPASSRCGASESYSSEVPCMYAVIAPKIVDFHMFFI